MSPQNGTRADGGSATIRCTLCPSLCCGPSCKSRAGNRCPVCVCHGRCPSDGCRFAVRKFVSVTVHIISAYAMYQGKVFGKVLHKSQHFCDLSGLTLKIMK